MRQSACLVLNPITVSNFASLFNCTPVGGRQTQWWPRHKAINFSWLGPELFCLLLGRPGFNCWFSFALVFQWCCLTPQGSPGVGRNTLFLSSPHLCFTARVFRKLLSMYVILCKYFLLVLRAGYGIWLYPFLFYLASGETGTGYWNLQRRLE